MEKNTQSILDRAERAMEAYQKGDRSPQLLSEMVELQEELDALMPHEVPPFMKRGRLQRPSSGEGQARGGCSL